VIVRQHARKAKTVKTQAYLYKWTELSTNKWYVGSRTAKGSYPNDGYICSSKIVKPLIQQNPSNWIREILCVSDAKYIRDLECKYLTLLNAQKDPISYNQSNATGRPTHNKPHSVASKELIKEKRAKQIPWNKGKGGYSLSIEHKEKIAIGMKNNPNVGHLHTDEAKLKMSNAKKGQTSHMLGKKHTDATKNKISNTKRGIV
jgi:group I intron endonuclease